jgi:hypothetical protein
LVKEHHTNIFILDPNSAHTHTHTDGVRLTQRRRALLPYAYDCGAWKFVKGTQSSVMGFDNKHMPADIIIQQRPSASSIPPFSLPSTHNGKKLETDCVIANAALVCLSPASILLSPRCVRVCVCVWQFQVFSSSNLFWRRPEMSPKGFSRCVCCVRTTRTRKSHEIGGLGSLPFAGLNYEKNRQRSFISTV